MRPQLLVAVLLTFAFAGQSPAQAPQPYRVLIPLYYEAPIPGAHGSLWTTPLAIHNPTAQEFQIRWCTSTPDGAPCILLLPGDAALKAGETQNRLPRFDPDTVNAQAARVLYIYGFQGENPEKLAFQLRAADTSRLATNAGTEIPVVRARDFRTSAVNLLNVPVDPRFRLTLRLYEMDQEVADFAVRIYSGNDLLRSETIQLTSPVPGFLEKLAPGYAQIGDLMGWIPASASPSVIRVEVEPLTAGSAFWTFISITNNDTQQLTLVTPQ
jgi:hypothetical protein